MTELNFKALLVGNGIYPDDPHNLPELRGAHNGLRIMEESLTHPQVGLFRKKNVQVLLDCTKTGIVEPAPDAAALGLDPPRVRVRVFDASGAELGWLELGDPMEHAMAARASASERVWRVSNDLGVDVPLSLEAFERNFLEQPACVHPQRLSAYRAGRDRSTRSQRTGAGCRFCPVNAVRSLERIGHPVGTR